jgi:DNA-directed RNA polymerase beta' subunit
MHVILDILDEGVVKRTASFSLNSTYDIMDPRFGVSIDCDICGRSKCDGHYAVLDLGTYLVHPMFSKNVISRIKTMCLECGNDTPANRPKNYKCVSCGYVTDRDSSSLEGFYKEDSLGDIRLMFEHRDLREKNFIVRHILIPPPGVRPRDDVEWPSDLSQAYISLIDVVRRGGNSLEHRNSVLRHYSKIVAGGKGSVVDKLISGKGGLFREIIKGKRLDSSFRSVITGDPYIGANEIMIPRVIASRVVVKEKCSQYNSNILREGDVYWDKRGDKANPGSLLEGFDYYRPLRDGDSVLFNRQPSLSRDSLMSFKVRVRRDDNLTISMNPVVTPPFNADFDGDEMNVFTNWNIESQAELEVLCNVDLSSKVQAIQDTITGSYLLTSNDVLVSPETVMDCAVSLQLEFVDPENARGIDLFKMSLPYDMDLEFPITKESICRTIPRNIIRTTRSNKNVLIFYEKLQKIVCIWSRECGFSTSIHDCIMTDEDSTEKDDKILTIEESYMSSQRRFSEWSYQKCLTGYDNTPICIMVKSGSKGNVINMSQIMTSVGHQHIDHDYGRRKNGSIVDKGFISSSYVSGLSPEELILHLVASRRGVIDTGVSTSNTGYLSRRLSMMLCNCYIDYMGTVVEGNRVISFLDSHNSKYFPTSLRTS